MNSKINWLFDSNSNFVAIERGYQATISGTKIGGPYTLTVIYVGPSAKGDRAPVSAPVVLPANTAYPTAKLAKQAFRVYLRAVPVTA
jgi:hypothetical protein